MLTEPVALVGAVDNNRVVRLSRFVQILQNSSDVVVDAANAAEIILHHELIGVARLLFVRVIRGRFELVLVQRIIEADNRRGRRFEQRRNAAIFKQVVRLRDCNAVEHVFVTGRVVKRIMRRFEMQHQAVRLTRFFLRFEPFQRAVCVDVRRVSLILFDVCFRAEFGVEVNALIVDDFVMVKPFRRVLQMPFSNQRGGVARILQSGGHPFAFRGNGGKKTSDAGAVRVLTGNNARPAGRAEREVAKHVVKPNAFVG